MHTGGRPVEILDQVAERYPIVMHGVSMNIGSASTRWTCDYLAELKSSCATVAAPGWSPITCAGPASDGAQPARPPAASLHRGGAAPPWLRTGPSQVQDRLGEPADSRRERLEHLCPSSRTFDLDGVGIHRRGSPEEADCGLLLDVNNIYVSTQNHGWDPHEYLRGTAWDHVVYFHLAGHTRYDTHLLDTHDGVVCDEVWELYGEAVRLSGGRSTVMEWDAEIPDFETVRAEVWKAKAFGDAKSGGTQKRLHA